MTPHNSALIGSIAKTVLLPGDPGRAEWVARTFLSKSEEITSVRGMRGFTGRFNDKEITVMASGMGGPSVGIYSYELFTHYEVESIIRIGTSGGLQKEIEVGDLVLALTASTDSNFAHQYNLNGNYSPCVDYSLFERAKWCFRATYFHLIMLLVKIVGRIGLVWVPLFKIWRLMLSIVLPPLLKRRLFRYLP